MIKEMRRKDRQMSDDNTKSVLHNALYGTLSTSNNENIPYGVPISFAYDGTDNIYLHCAAEGMKLDNIKVNSNVCFSTVESAATDAAKFTSQFKSAIAFGTISVLTDIPEKKAALTLLIKKYSPEFYDKGMGYIEKACEKTTVLKIKISTMTGKEHK
ncbi:pyridoxamine 5'-phosphate oxidase family protein [Pectinatus brassicae]|uniref:Uncharacterized protein n=1 Tax=Pectinatus brassicae TaxID=862415 RepID=A0A840UR52_9FIRM|nr:pyridoxamine 5'-phosphate oxidase family protein [Pectinatus brassicae]MBB5335035.1 hypothetical protein [Pectinatus brassicae]